jgi:hypothetical protein
VEFLGIGVEDVGDGLGSFGGLGEFRGRLRLGGGFLFFYFCDRGGNFPGRRGERFHDILRRVGMAVCKKAERYQQADDDPDSFLHCSALLIFQYL